MMLDSNEKKEEFEKPFLRAWKTFAYQASGRESPKHPATIEASMVVSEENKIKLREYDSTYTEFHRKTEELPDASETFGEVRALGNTLTTINISKSEVSEEVRNFLDKIHNDGVPLDQVTTEIFDWLDKTNSRGNYLLIVPKNE